MLSREVICSEKKLLTIRGSSATPDFDSSLSQEQQPRGEFVEYNTMYLAFDDIIEEPNVPRNSYYMKVTEAEADEYEVGKTYTISIG